MKIKKFGNENSNASLDWVLGGVQWFLMINNVHDVNEKINFLINKISHVLNIIS